ncbi:hypothetical protein [Deinococcus wulumuqiensis]|uniref:hypothetical protein n=1 Tax=Deinococcus wulumuqiensis TaxID=980427 RepID=UPI00242B9D98|nr:hypothetical protein [Deinococcus wulumuqiensis]
MKKWLVTLSLFACSSALACPQAKTMFNGAVPATIHGLNPFCGDQGQYWVNSFTRAFKSSGAKVHYVETYKSYAASGEALENTIGSVHTLLERIGYKYEGVEELSDGGAVMTFHKANTTKRHIAAIVRPMSGFLMFAFVNMDMPYEHSWEEQYEN